MIICIVKAYYQALKANFRETGVRRCCKKYLRAPLFLEINNITIKSYLDQINKDSYLWTF